MFNCRLINTKVRYAIISFMKEITYKNIHICFTERKDLNQRIINNRPTNISILIPNQKHTNKVLKHNQDLSQEADGIYTSERNIALGVLTADCMPIVIFNEEELAVVHAGWRGLFSGIIENACGMFKNKPKHAFIGPSIRKCCYQVQREFIEHLNVEDRFFNCIDGKYFLSLQDVAKEKLHKLGIKDIHDINQCTCCTGNYFSYRKGDFDDRILTYAYIRG